MNLNKFLLFSKFRNPGSVKTWLIPLLGANASADLHKIPEEITIDKILTAKSRIHLVPKMQLTGTDLDQMLKWPGPTFIYKKQAEDRFGRRMSFAFKIAF
jgi:uncharacterized protein